MHHAVPLLIKLRESPLKTEYEVAVTAPMMFWDAVVSTVIDDEWLFRTVYKLVFPTAVGSVIVCAPVTMYT